MTCCREWFRCAVMCLAVHLLFELVESLLGTIGAL